MNTIIFTFDNVLFVFVQYRRSDDNAWAYFNAERIPADALSFVMRDLEPNSAYHIKLAAKNEFGMGEFDQYHSATNTLSFRPIFQPEVSVKGLTWNSVSIGWTQPGEERIQEHIDYYLLTKSDGKGDEVSLAHPSDTYSFYLWTQLNAATNYSFAVSACNGYTRDCGPPSNAVVQQTEDGVAGKPESVHIACKHDNVSGMNFVEVKWKPPRNRNGQIELYNVRI